jgi:hypothetical protein
VSTLSYADLQKRDLETIDDWFKNHIVKAHVHHGKVEQFVWGEPGTRNCKIQYLLHNNYLYVSGDLGEAIYEWSEDVSLKFLADCGMDYFGGKCRASSEEPKGKTWDRDKVKNWIEARLAEWAVDRPELDFSGKREKEIPREPLSFEACAELMKAEDGVYLEDEVIGHAGSWAHFIYESNGLIAHDRKLPIKGSSHGLLCFPRIRF